MLFRKANIRIKGIPKEKREKGVDSLFKEIVAENFPNLGKNLHIKVHKALGSQCKNTFSMTHYKRAVKNQQ